MKNFYKGQLVPVRDIPNDEDNPAKNNENCEDYETIELD